MSRSTPLKPGSGYKWLICATATLLMFCLTGLNVSSFAIYLPYIRQANDFSSTQVNLIITYREIARLAGLLLVGKFYKKVSIRVGATISLACTGVAFVLYGYAQRHVVYCIAALICGFSFGLGSTVGNIAIDDWFEKKKASAIGIAAAGTGLASIIVPIAATALIQRSSLRTTLILEGIFIFAASAITFCTLRSNPNHSSPVAQQSTQGHSECVKSSGYTLSTKLVFWLILGVFFIGLAVTGVASGLAQIVREFYDETQTSFLISLFGIALFTGKIITGRLIDVIGVFKINFISFICLGVGAFGISAVPQLRSLLILFIIMVGFGASLSTVSVPLYASDYCRPGQYSNVFRKFAIAQTFGGLVVSYLTGFLADTTGSNCALFSVLAVLALASGVIIQLIYLSNRK